MTKEHEQAIKNLEGFIDHFHTIIKQAEKANDCAFDFMQAEDDIITFGIAIQAIKDFDKMQNVLDSIRVEIEQKARPYELGGRENGKSIRYGLCMALEIVDKYRAECLDKELESESKDADSN